MGLVVSIVNFIQSRSLNHRQFKIMLEEVECEYKGVAYYCKIRGLSSPKTLRRFNILLPEIDLFMRNKGRECDEFKDQFWITDLVFLADITAYVSSEPSATGKETGHISTPEIHHCIQYKA